MTSEYEKARETLRRKTRLEKVDRWVDDPKLVCDITDLADFARTEPPKSPSDAEGFERVLAFARRRIEDIRVKNAQERYYAYETPEADERSDVQTLTERSETSSEDGVGEEV